MSTDNPTPEAEPLLHLATLLAVLAKLRDRLDAIPALVADDSDDHPLTHVELAGWEARVEALEAFAGDVALMLKDVDPRARVVVLPDIDDDWRQAIEVVKSGPGSWTWAGKKFRVTDPDAASTYAATLLAAVDAEFAGGAR